MTALSPPGARPSRWTPATAPQRRLLAAVTVLLAMHLLATALFVLGG